MDNMQLENDHFLLEIFQAPLNCSRATFNISDEGNIIENWEFVGTDLVNNENVAHLRITTHQPIARETLQESLVVCSDEYDIMGADVFLFDEHEQKRPSVQPGDSLTTIELKKHLNIGNTVTHPPLCGKGPHQVSRVVKLSDNKVTIAQHGNEHDIDWNTITWARTS